MKKLFETWTIYSTGKNENGGTPCMTYMRCGKEITKYLGEVLDSPEDAEVLRQMDTAMREVHQDFLHKNAASNISASETYLD